MAGHRQDDEAEFIALTQMCYVACATLTYLLQCRPALATKLYRIDGRAATEQNAAALKAEGSALKQALQQQVS